MPSYSLKKNRKGQIAETITWVIATIIIVFLISASIYAAILLGESKTVDKSKAGISGSDSLDWVSQKTGLALNINNKNSDKIISWVKESDINAVP